MNLGLLRTRETVRYRETSVRRCKTALDKLTNHQVLIRKKLYSTQFQGLRDLLKTSTKVLDEVFPTLLEATQVYVLSVLRSTLFMVSVLLKEDT